MKRIEKKSHLIRNAFCFMLCCCIAGLLISVFTFNANPGRTDAEATILLTFKGAANGEAPNGSSYSMDGLMSDEVLEQALTDTSLNGKYTVEQIRENLSVSGVYPDNIVEQMTRYVSLLSENTNEQVQFTDYHPTLFRVVLYHDFDPSISREDLQKILTAVLTRFRSYFETRYSVSPTQTQMVPELTQYDYPQRVDIIREFTVLQLRYAEEMAAKEPSFRVNGKGFDDIVVRFNTILKVDVERLYGMIAMNALSKDSERLKAQYENQIRSLQIKLKESNAEIALLDKLIGEYQKDEIMYVSTGGSLQKVSSGSGVTYDELVTKRKAISEDIAQTNAQITEYETKMQDFSSEGAEQVSHEEDTDLTEGTESIILTDEERAQEVRRLEERIDALVVKRDEIISDFSKILKAFSNQNMDEQGFVISEVQYRKPSIFSGTFVAKAVKTTGPICALGFMLCLAYIIIRRVKQEKASA